MQCLKSRTVFVKSTIPIDIIAKIIEIISGILPLLIVIQYVEL